MWFAMKRSLPSLFQNLLGMLYIFVVSVCCLASIFLPVQHLLTRPQISLIAFGQCEAPLAFWCVLESASFPKNLGVVIQLHFCLSHLPHATSSSLYFQLITSLCLLFHGFLCFMSISGELYVCSALLHRWEFTFPTLTALGRILVGAWWLTI